MRRMTASATARESSGGDPRRILIVNPFGIGDVLFTTPFIRALRQAFPATRLGYVCNRRTERILRENPQLNDLFIYEKDELVRMLRQSWWKCLVYVVGLLWRVRRAKFDLVVDLSMGERYAFILKSLGVTRRVGFDYRHRGRFLTERLPIDGYHDTHVVEYYRRLLAFMGILLCDPSLELHASTEDERWADQWLEGHHVRRDRPLVGMMPAGGVSWGLDAPFRRWSFEGFAAVGDALAERLDAQLLLFGERTDRTVCETVARLMKHPVIDVSGATTLGQFISLLSRLGLVICNDGGPLHLAVSRGVKTVSIFGPVDPRVYGPYPADESRHRVIRREELLCRPCYHQFKLPPCPYERACLTLEEPGTVIEACLDLLG